MPAGPPPRDPRPTDGTGAPHGAADTGVRVARIVAAAEETAEALRTDAQHAAEARVAEAERRADERIAEAERAAALRVDA
ncbi:MAG: hypothetical protein Q7T67_18175, partial [Patulibacter sp.]